MIEGHLGLDRAVLSAVMPEATLNPAMAAQASEFRSHEVRCFCSSIRDNTGQGREKGSRRVLACELSSWQEGSRVHARRWVTLVKPQRRVVLGCSANKYLPEQTQSEV